METNQQGLPETLSPVAHSAPIVSPELAQAQFKSEAASAVEDTEGTSEDDLSFVKRKNDFYAEFFETEKKARVKGSEVASSLLTFISVEEIMPEVKAKPGRKRKNQSLERQEPEAWSVHIHFHDDIGNEAQKFIQELSNRESPFRLRIVQTDSSGSPVEAILLKDCQVLPEASYAGSRYFDSLNTGPRGVRVRVRAESLAHKHF